LIFPLKKEWYEKIKSDEKTIEYREVKPYWEKRLFTTIHAKNDVVFSPSWCYLQEGYNPKRRLEASITKIEVVDGKDTDLHIDKPVYAIHLAEVREELENA
nr:hypothetical protein [Treponema sp.]